MTIVERRIRCPFCDEAMTILLDSSAGDQSYIEDCQVCCQPMQISFELSNEELISLQVDCATEAGRLVGRRNGRRHHRHTGIGG